MREKRELNFALRWRQSNPAVYQKETARKRWTLGGGLALVLILLVSSPWIWAYELQLTLNQTNQQIISMAHIEALWQKANKLKFQADNQAKVLALAKSSTLNPQSNMDRLLKLLPAGSSVETYNLQGDTLNLRVSTPTPVDVVQIWKNLQDSHMFVNVDIQTLSLQDKVQTLNFDLKLNQVKANATSGRQ